MSFIYIQLVMGLKYGKGSVALHTMLRNFCLVQICANIMILAYFSKMRLHVYCL